MDEKPKELSLIAALEAGVDDFVGVISQLKILAATARARIAEATDLGQKAQFALNDLANRTAMVKIREEAVASKEKRILTAEEIAKAKDDLEAGWAGLANRLKSFERECSEKRAVVEQQLSDVLVERKALKEGMVLLEKDRGNYKFKILEEFAKTAGTK
jgi:hypothetical protein